MTGEKKKLDVSAEDKAPTPVRNTEQSLRLATLLKLEKIPEIEAKGFLAGTGLKSSDKMTRSAFVKRFNAWRNQLAGKETR